MLLVFKQLQENCQCHVRFQYVKLRLPSFGQFTKK